MIFIISHNGRLNTLLSTNNTVQVIDFMYIIALEYYYLLNRFFCLFIFNKANTLRKWLKNPLIKSIRIKRRKNCNLVIRTKE